MRKGIRISALVCIFAVLFCAMSSGAKAADNSSEIVIRISAAGDCTLGNDEKQAGIPTCFKKIYDLGGPDFFLQEVKDIFEKDDLTMVNLEGTLTTGGERSAAKKWCFRGDPEYIDILKGSSVEAVAFANNHCRDYGEESYTDTMDLLEKEGILCASEDGIFIKDVRGIKIGVMALNSAFRKSDTKKDREYDDTQELKDLTVKGIQELRDQKADLIFVHYHWGIEGNFNPSVQQKELGHFAVDNGADLVIGHHPHVLQPVEYYNNAYIIYSLGNFCFGGNSNPKDRNSMIWTQEFRFSDGRLTGQSAKIIPCLISSESKYNNYQPVQAEGKDAQYILNRLATGSKKMNVVISVSDGTVTVPENEESGR